MRKNVLNGTLQYIIKHSRWPFVSRSCLFEWLAARGRVFEVVSLILQLSGCFGFSFAPYKHMSFWCLPLAWPDLNCCASDVLFDNKKEYVC